MWYVTVGISKLKPILCPSNKEVMYIKTCPGQSHNYKIVREQRTSLSLTETSCDPLLLGCTALCPLPLILCQAFDLPSHCCTMSPRSRLPPHLVILGPRYYGILHASSYSSKTQRQNLGPQALCTCLHFRHWCPFWSYCALVVLYSPEPRTAALIAVYQV